MPYGGLKAVKLDVNGDGTDEIAVAGLQSELIEHVESTVWFNISGVVGQNDKHADYNVYPYVALVRYDASGKKLQPFASSYAWRGDVVFNRHFTSYNGNSDNPFGLQEYNLALGTVNSDFYPVVDRYIAIGAGPLFGRQGTVKPGEDIVLHYLGSNMTLLRYNGSALAAAGSSKAYDSTAFVTSDFAGEGIELGKPVHLVSPAHRSYMAVLQAPPYHVDNIAVDGSALTLTPTNFSYIKGSKTTYAKSSSESEKKNIKFNIKETIDTIFAIDCDMTRNVIGGYNTFKDVYDTVKDVASFIPGANEYAKKADAVVSKVTDFVDKCIDKIETVKEGYDSDIQAFAAKDSLSTERLDAVYIAEAKQHIWRYPIITRPAPDWGIEYTSTDAYVAKQDFVTFSLYDDAEDRTFNADPSFQPAHENGNIFSYPANVANIEGYGYKQKVLSGIKNV